MPGQPSPGPALQGKASELVAGSARLFLGLCLLRRFFGGASFFLSFFSLFFGGVCYKLCMKSVEFVG